MTVVVAVNYINLVVKFVYMSGIEYYSDALADCRGEESFEDRLSCEEEVSNEFKSEIEAKGLLGMHAKDKLDSTNAKAMIRSLDKTSNQLNDVTNVKDLGGGLLQVRTNAGESDFYVKNDDPRNIAWTKQVRNLTDIIEDDSSSVVHQNMNNGIMVLTDEGKSPVSSDDVSGMEAGMAVVTESILLDNDRNKKNLAVDNGVVSEIDFDRSLVDGIPVTELAQFKWQMNEISAGKFATVLQCGGWDNAFEAAADARCVDEPVDPEFREGIKAGVNRFKSFFDDSRVGVDDVAPMATDGVEDRIQALDKAAHSSGSIDYDQRDLNV
jgi:hypothetical protein